MPSCLPSCEPIGWKMEEPNALDYLLAVRRPAVIGHVSIGCV